MRPPVDTIESTIKRFIQSDPVSAAIVGPVCHLQDRDTQDADLILRSVCENYLDAYRRGDEHGLDAADSAMSFLDMVRRAAVESARWS